MKVNLYFCNFMKISTQSNLYSNLLLLIINYLPEMFKITLYFQRQIFPNERGTGHYLLQSK